MSTLYRKLRLNRVDFVDKGANPGAHITLAKRAPTEDRQMADTKDVLPEGVAKRLADLDAENKALAKRVADAEAKAEADAKTAKEQGEVVAKMLENAAKSEALSVAKGMDKLPGKVEETAHLLFIAKRAFSTEDFAQFEKMLKACDAQIKASKVFSAIGKDGDGEGASALDQLISKRMSEKNETHSQALRYVTSTPEGKAAWAEVRGGN